MRAAMVAASIYNANPFRSRDAEVVSPLDFLAPEERRELEPPQTLGDQVKVLTDIFGCGPGKPSKVA